jgi:uncharacterized membrane protein
MKTLSGTVCSVIALCLFFSTADAKYEDYFLKNGNTYTSIDYPGSNGTRVYGINDAGTVVGAYFDFTGWHGFLMNGSTYTSFDYPGSYWTEAGGINDAGIVVGSYMDSTNPGRRHGFLMSGNTFSSFDYPGEYETFAIGINDAGTILIGTHHTPESPTMLLLGLGLMGVAGIRRKLS